MMEHSDINLRTPFSGEAGRQVQPLSSEVKGEQVRSSPDIEPIENMSLSSTVDTQMGNAPGPPQAISLGNTAGVQQPKVQTAFIHKLYSMLEDPGIQHLISWSPSNESFVVSPTGEFSKVLSQYFKHTNISSFVRQLNMYGFHKVNDVFHTGSPDSTLWEFKHGNGSFKRGDLVGLREIKRRASRHALIHRDSFSGTKSTAASAPGTPNEQPSDAMESRLLGVEQTMFELSNRLVRTEESNAILASRWQSAIEGLSRCHQWTSDISQFMMGLFPSDAPVLREIQSLQREIERHTQLLDEPQDLRDHQPFPPSLHDNSVPLSPRQRPIEDDSRRSSYSGQFRAGGYFRPPAPPHLANPPRRFGSVGLTGSSSPNALRPQQPVQPPPQHPLSSYQSPPNHLSRRHTSADIRQIGWQPNPNSPFSGIGHSSHWPPSPNRPVSNESSRENLPGYDLAPNQRPHNPLFPARTTPPPNDPSEGWTFGNASKFLPPREAGHTAPPTRRSSLASSSVHALLNPPDFSGDREGQSDGEPDDRKRKRVM